MSFIRREWWADTETPVSLFCALEPGFRCAALFESVEGRERWARRSMIALGNQTPLQAQTAEEVAGVVAQLDLKDEPGSLLDGAFGYFTYEAASAFIPLPNTPRATQPLCEFFKPDAVMLYDHRTHTVEGYFRNEQVEVDIMRKLAERLGEGRLARMKDATIAHRPHIRVRRQFSGAEYQRKVEQAKEYIAAGDAFQIVLSQKFWIDGHGVDLIDAYRKLRRQNPSPYLFYLRTGQLEAAGASPETLVRVEDGQIHVRPLAGTRPRGKTDAEDVAHEKSLLADPKELAEHLMLIDLGRNDVGKVATPASVVVDPMMVVERYSHVMHIVSEVCGQLREDLTALDAFASAFPAGTLSGAPKKRAMEIIGELEGSPRGLYGGAVGYFASKRSCDFAIAIRTVTRSENACVVQAGAGVVYDSNPVEENAECLRKAASALSSVDAYVSDATSESVVEALSEPPTETKREVVRES